VLHLVISEEKSPGFRCGVVVCCQRTQRKLAFRSMRRCTPSGTVINVGDSSKQQQS
jgi:hypothetical protein